MNDILLIFQVLTQTLAFFLGFRIYLHTKQRWLGFLLVAFFFMTMRRITAFIGFNDIYNVELFDKILIPLVISLCIFKAMLELNKNRS